MSGVLARITVDLYAGLPGGWASRSLMRSMARAALMAMAVWQVVMVATLAGEPTPIADAWPVLIGHVALAVVALLAREGLLPAATVVVGAYALFVADWYVADSLEESFMLAACWMVNLAAAVPSLAIRGRRALLIPLLVVPGVPTVMVLVRPDLPLALPISIALTAIAITLVTRLGVGSLIDFVRRADAEQAAAEREGEVAAAQRSAAERASEDARVLHDTVINTLAALATGGAATSERGLVVERCERDIRTVERLRDGRPVAGVGGLREAAEGHGITVRHTGIADAELTSVEARLPPAGLDAVGRALAEIVRNSAKHSGAETAELDIAVESDVLVLVVRDEGRGFDGLVDSRRGLARSVIERARSAGVDVDLVTAPGQGTEVTLRCPLSGSAGTEETLDQRRFSEIVAGLQLQAAFVMSAGLAVVGFYLALTNHHGDLNGEYAMAIVVGLSCGAAFISHRRSGSLGPGVIAVLALAAPIAFLFSAEAVDFGRRDAILWQAIGPTGPLLVLMTCARRRTFVVATALYAATVLGVAGVVGVDDHGAAYAVLVAGAAGLGLVATWNGFRTAVRAIGSRAAEDQLRAARARAEVAARRSAATAGQRWRDAGLESSMQLLRRVSTGQQDPMSSDFQRQCASEETYLRELTQLNPDLVVMGDWFARALAKARTNAVRLAVRSGDTDVRADSAPMLGELVLAATEHVPAGGTLTVALFPSGDDVTMTLVAPHPSLEPLTTRTLPANVSMDFRILQQQDLIQIQCERGGL